MFRVRLWPSDLFRIDWPDTARLMGMLRAYGPALLFGLRFWAAVCLALYAAFWLELDNPFWAGSTAAIVAQPTLGASLRKGWFRMVGTVIGAVAVVVLTALFVQSRVGFLLGLALWGTACAVMASVLRNFAAYSAALAGYTAAIIASDELGAVGGATGDVFILAITRACEIGLGIVSAGLVVTGTTVGGAPRRLAHQLAALSAEITERFAGTFSLSEAELPATRAVRRDLVRRVTALEPLIEDALGESSSVRYHGSRLSAARDGLFAALSAWQTTAAHLERLGSRGHGEAEPIRRSLPDDVHPLTAEDEASDHSANLRRFRQTCVASIRALIALPNRTPSRQLLADQAARGLTAIKRVLDGLMLLIEPRQASRPAPPSWFSVPDYLPVVINALRVFLAIGVVELFWIVTAWPGGAGAITFVAIITILFSPMADMAYANTASIAVGIVLSVVCAMVVAFAILPAFSTFAGLSFAIGLVLVPVGTALALGWRPPLVLLLAATFPTLLAPTNEQIYNTVQFYNTALGVATGAGAALLSFYLVPPLPPAIKARRLLMLTLRDLRRLAAGVGSQTPRDWTRRVYGRLSQMPEQAEPVQRAQLMAALGVGTEIIRLCRLARRLGRDAELEAALACLADGDCASTTSHLARLDQELAALPLATPRALLRARSSVLVISEALERYADYFSGARPR
jgi:uncharacterized membrane protein YccC